MKETSRITVVTYWRGAMGNAVRSTATFSGHISDSEVERKMLFERHTSNQRIEKSEHRFN